MKIQMSKYKNVYENSHNFKMPTLANYNYIQCDSLHYRIRILGLILVLNLIVY